MDVLDQRIHKLVTKHYDPSHPGFSQAIVLLSSLRTLTEEQTQIPLEQVTKPRLYFYSFLRSSILAEKDTRKLFSMSTLLLFLLKDGIKHKDLSLLAFLQKDDLMEKRILELLSKRKDKFAGSYTLESEVGLLFLAFMKTREKQSWQDFTLSKGRLDMLFELATHNKKILRKNALAFLKQLLRDPQKNSQYMSLNQPIESKLKL